MRKNIVIAILMVIIAGLSILLYRATRYPKTFVVEVLPALEEQRQVCETLRQQVNWLRRNMENPITELEKKYNLEPAPDRFEETLDVRDKEIYRERKKQMPFVFPYKEEYSMSYDLLPEKLKTIKGFRDLTPMIQFTNLYSKQEINSANEDIAFYFERLKQLGVIIKKE